MRLKEDKSNWNASNVLRKQAQVPDAPIYKSKKDTRKWCKGKVGTEHKYEYAVKWQIGNASFHVFKCTACGKEKW